jgi:hypothetical protein
MGQKEKDMDVNGDGWDIGVHHRCQEARNSMFLF